MNYNIELKDWIKIVDVACGTWQKKLLYYSADFLYKTHVTVNDSFLAEMLDASDQSQKDLILSLFPDYNKKEDPYKKFRDAQKEGKVIQWCNEKNIWENLKSGIGWAYHSPPEYYRIKHKHQDMIDEWEASDRTKKLEYFCKSRSKWDIISEPSWSEEVEYRFKLEEPKYVPYTFEDAKELIGKTVKHKSQGFLALITQVGSRGVVTSDVSKSYDVLLGYYTDIDGNPLGKIKTK